MINQFFISNSRSLENIIDFRFTRSCSSSRSDICESYISGLSLVFSSYKHICKCKNRADLWSDSTLLLELVFGPNFGADFIEISFYDFLELNLSDSIES